MKSNDILFAIGILLLGMALFGCILCFVGICEVAFGGGNSDAAKFAGWVVNAIR